jgi:uncharacterized protein YmfQ (DUF2313 family)
VTQSRFSHDDYKAALLSLLPTGRVWPKDPDAVQNDVLDGLAPTFVRLDARAQALLVDAFPASSLELLPEWELSLGLPDACEGEDQILQVRRAQVVNRLVNAGGQSIPYYLAALGRLGYADATVQEYSPFRTDIDVADSILYEESWAHAWQISVPDLRVFYFSTDISAADEPLVSIANSVIVCVIDALKPAHTTVLYVTV